MGLNAPSNSALCIVNPRDIDDIADSLADNASLKVALRFLAEVYETIALIAAHPEMGWLCKISHPKLASARTFRVSKRFPEYLIFYQVGDERIEVLRILNARQDLDALFERAEESDWGAEGGPH